MKVNVNKDRIAAEAGTLLVKWTDDNTIGIPILDEQHRGLTTTMNSLFYACRNNFDDQMIKPAIALISWHAKVHFLTEEDFMRRIGYPGLTHHKMEHSMLISGVRVESRKALAIKEPIVFLKFLKKWYTSHVKESDRLYAEYFSKL